MKKFLIQLTAFLCLLGILFFMIPILLNKIVQSKVNCSIPKDKTTLILSDSSLECAIDDTVLEHTFSYAKSADPYMLQYIKLLKIHAKNPQIKNLILGYSYDNVSTQQDRFKDDSFINGKFSAYYPLLTGQNVLELMKQNANATFFSIPKTLDKNKKFVISALKGEEINLSQLGIGGHLSLKESQWKKDLKFKENQKGDQKVEVSLVQKEYILKIYDYCQKNKIAITLISSPIHPKLVERNKAFITFAKSFKEEFLPNSEWLDYSQFPLDEGDYADLAHLNYKGVAKFSLTLKAKLANKNETK